VADGHFEVGSARSLRENLEEGAEKKSEPVSVILSQQGSEQNLGQPSEKISSKKSQPSQQGSEQNLGQPSEKISSKKSQPSQQGSEQNLDAALKKISTLGSKPS
jgi:hypothetical protein